MIYLKWHITPGVPSNWQFFIPFSISFRICGNKGRQERFLRVQHGIRNSMCIRCMSHKNRKASATCYNLRMRSKLTLVSSYLPVVEMSLSPKNKDKKNRRWRKNNFQRTSAYKKNHLHLHLRRRMCLGRSDMWMRTMYEQETWNSIKNEGKEAKCTKDNVEVEIQ